MRREFVTLVLPLSFVVRNFAEIQYASMSTGAQRSGDILIIVLNFELMILFESVPE
jgi:hypothetical protein